MDYFLSHTTGYRFEVIIKECVLQVSTVSTKHESLANLLFHLTKPGVLSFTV